MLHLKFFVTEKELLQEMSEIISSFFVGVAHDQR